VAAELAAVPAAERAAEPHALEQGPLLCGQHFFQRLKNKKIRINHVANLETCNMLLVSDSFQSLKTGPEGFVHFFGNKMLSPCCFLRVKSSVVDQDLLNPAPDTNPDPAFQVNPDPGF
jgi:hypothetical protein